MTRAAFFPFVLVCSLAASGALGAQPADVAGLALYEGADREQRLVKGARAGRFDFDVVETNGPELESLHREKLLQRADSPHFPDLLSDAIRPHREWVGTRLNMFVHAYNTNLVKKAELPKSYEDFLDPKWKGRLGKILVGLRQ